MKKLFLTCAAVAALWIGMLVFLPGLAAAQGSGGTVIFPTLTSISADVVIPEEPLEVSGMGGFVQFPDNSPDESPRAFNLFFDGVLIEEDDPVALVCENNQCFAAFSIPSDATPGVHAISTEGGSSLQITIV